MNSYMLLTKKIIDLAVLQFPDEIYSIANYFLSES
jgi:hypothetical protein